MGAKNVLVVDDDAMSVKLVSFVLRADGYDVTTASNATDALALLGSDLPDLILMDLQLPGMSGLELTRRLKADVRTRAILIVGMTAYSAIGDEAKARAAGCDGYLMKPADAHMIARLVSDFLR